MKTLLSVLAGLAVLAMVAHPLPAAQKQGDKARRKQKNKKKADRKPQARKVPFGQSIDAIDAKVSLTDEQKARLRTLIESRERALAKGMAAGGSSAQKVRSQIQAAYEKKMFAVLTAEQRGKWNGPILLRAVRDEFSLLYLTMSQEERVESLCQAQARRIAVPLDPKRHAGIIKSVLAMVYKNILTPEQRREYARLASAKNRNNRGDKDRKNSNRNRRARGRNRNRRNKNNKNRNRARMPTGKAPGGLNTPKAGGFPKVGGGGPRK